MIEIGGYSLIYDKNRNKIIITLPQTAETATTTALPIVNRGVDIPECDFAPVLRAAMRVIKEADDG